MEYILLSLRMCTKLHRNRFDRSWSKFDFKISSLQTSLQTNKQTYGESILSKTL